MTSIETRLANLEHLARDPRYRFSRDFCNAAGISPSYLSQLRAGTKTLGNALARRIEDSLKLPVGALDEPAPVLVPHGTGRPDAEVMSAAYAIQAMPAQSRAAFIRLALSVASDKLVEAAQKQPEAVAKATPFEITDVTASHSSQEAKGRRSRVRSKV